MARGPALAVGLSTPPLLAGRTEVTSGLDAFCLEEFDNRGRYFPGRSLLCFGRALDAPVPRLGAQNCHIHPDPSCLESDELFRLHREPQGTGREGEP